MSNRREINIVINGNRFRLEVAPGVMLIDVLRDELGLTGTKAGCRKGECGACNVLINGNLFSSCLYPALRADGKSVLTIEGLKKDGELDPIQEAFIRAGAVQCGFCTPGMIMSSKALLNGTKAPSPRQVRTALSGNLCRCGGYQRIVNAVLAVSRKRLRK